MHNLLPHSYQFHHRALTDPVGGWLNINDDTAVSENMDWFIIMFPNKLII